MTELSSVEQQSKSVRDSLIDSGKRDEMAMKQHKCSPALKENDVIQHAFKHFDDETNWVAMEWFKRTVKKS